MWEFVRARFNSAKRQTSRTQTRQARRSRRQLQPELLEDRLLLTASLQPISNITVPALQGYTVPLLASPSATDPQTFEVTSSNPDISVSSPQGEFWTIGVSYTDPNNSSNSFTGSLTFQLFQNLTPKTVSAITALINDNYFVNTAKYFSRVATGFPGATDYLIQGGSPTQTGVQTSSPVTFTPEPLQQLAFTGSDQLAMASVGEASTTSTQFFVTTGAPNANLSYTYTIFGQLVSGQAVLAKITQIPLTTNSVTNEDSEPVNPLTITSTTLTGSDPNGVAIINTSQARPGETATINVTAVDADGTHAVQTFNVTVGAYAGPTLSSVLNNVNFKPYANPTASTGSF